MLQDVILCSEPLLDEGTGGLSAAMFNRPGVAGAVLQSPPSLTYSFIQ